MEKAETQLTDAVIRTIRDAARKLTGPKRRQFQAQVALDYLGGSARKAQTVFGWSRKTVVLGLNELRTGITCVDSFAMRGRPKSEDAQPQLLEDIVALVEPQSQTDPKFQGRFQYTRMTAKAVRQALIDEKDWKDEQLPHENTIGVILNRLGYRLRRVQKAKPIKRVKETDAIFETVHEENEKSDQRDDSIRISIDTKAKVNVGPFSRRGQSRGACTVEAADHDFEPEHKLVPFGILDVMAGWLTIIFGTSRETSDFIVDCLQQWWHDNQGRYGHITQLVINLDNGPELQSRRTQFMARLVEFAEQTGLEIVLVYYPPYHSKYNPIERCWGILEMHWNGTLLDSIETVCDWARTMTWKQIAPAIRLLDRVYDKGVSLTKQAFEAIEKRLQRDERLPKYHVVIQPTTA
jgi:transposase